jgi:hypothetical protein
MAFIDPNQNLQSQPGQQPSGGPAPTDGSAPTVSGSGSSDVGGVSTAGVGAGGQGGWTNIQAYLNANQGNNTTSNALNNMVGGAFNQEQQNIDKSSQDAKSAADKATAGQMSQDDIMKGVEGGQNQDFTNIRNYLNNPYSNPQQYSYGMGGQAQAYGQGLATDQGFEGLRNNLYQQAAGQPLSSGQMALQNQLDVNDPNVAASRQNLLAQYGGLQNNANDATAGTNAYVQNKANDYNSGIQTANQAIQDDANNWKGQSDAYNNAQGGTPSPAHFGGILNPQAPRTYQNIQNYLTGATGS